MCIDQWLDEIIRLEWQNKWLDRFTNYNLKLVCESLQVCQESCGNILAIKIVQWYNSRILAITVICFCVNLERDYEFFSVIGFKLFWDD